MGQVIWISITEIKINKWGAGMMSAKSISEMVAETPRPHIQENGRVVIETAGPGDFVGEKIIYQKALQS